MEFALTARKHISVVKHRAFELLVLPSECVFVVPLDNKTAQLSDLQLGYELESHLLIDAESMVSDMHACTLGAIALVADGSEVADAFTVAELHSTIALTARTGLVIQGFFNRLVPGSRAEGTICFVAADSPQAEIADVVLVHQQRIVNWRYCASENARSVCNELIEMAQLGDVVKIVWIGITPANLANPASASASIRASQAVEVSSWSADELVDEAAQLVLRGKQLPLVNLTGPCLPAIDPLKPAMRFGYVGLASLVLTGLLLIGGLYYRAMLYRAETESVVAAQETLFRQLFPGQKIPVGLMSRFQSEQRRLRLTRGTESRPEVANVLKVLYRFLESLPPESDVRYQIQNMRFEQDSLAVLSGSVATLEDLDQFREALEKGGFVLPPISGRPGAQGVPVQWSSVTWKPPQPSKNGGEQ